MPFCQEVRALVGIKDFTGGASSQTTGQSAQASSTDIEIMAEVTTTSAPEATPTGVRNKLSRKAQNAARLSPSG